MKTPLLSPGSVTEYAAYSKWGSPKRIPPGAVLEWFDAVDHHRGTGLPRRSVVDHVDRMNVVDTAGAFHYWPTLRNAFGFKITVPPANA